MTTVLGARVETLMMVISLERKLFQLKNVRKAIVQISTLSLYGIRGDHKEIRNVQLHHICDVMCVRDSSFMCGNLLKPLEAFMLAAFMLHNK